MKRQCNISCAPEADSAALVFHSTRQSKALQSASSANENNTIDAAQKADAISSFATGAGRQRTRKLSDSQVAEIRRRRAAGETTVALAKEFGVSQSLVSGLAIGRWRTDAGGTLSRVHVDTETAEEKLNFFRIVRGGDECWGWSGGLTADGYSRFSFRWKNVPGHKLALELKLGRALRGDEVTRHMCHNRVCTNPAHLAVGTPAENVADMVAAGRSTRGERNWSAKLTKQQVVQIMALAERDGFSVEATARDYGVCGRTIYHVVNGTRWRHIPRPSCNDNSLPANDQQQLGDHQ